MFPCTYTKKEEKIEEKKEKKTVTLDQNSLSCKIYSL